VVGPLGGGSRDALLGRCADGDGPATVGPEGVGETEARGERAEQQAGEDHGADIDTEGVGGEERTGRRRHEGMGHRGADGDREHVEQVILAGARGHGARERNEQEKHGVEKHRHAEHEPAGGEDERGAFLAEQAERRAHDAVGAAAVQQADADDGSHGDEDAEIGARAAELIGDFRAEGFVGAGLGLGGRTFLGEHGLFDGGAWRERRDNDGGGEERDEGVEF
jgi:hypothetical protein